MCMVAEISAPYQASLCKGLNSFPHSLINLPGIILQVRNTKMKKNAVEVPNQNPMY